MLIDPDQGESIQAAIKKKYRQLKSVLRPDQILDEMFSEDMIAEEEHTEVKKKSITDRNDFILKKAISNPSLAKMFMKLLRETGQGQLVTCLVWKRSASEMYINRITDSGYADKV